MDIPIIDLGELGSDTRADDSIGEAIAAACRSVGFFYIADHGVPSDLVDSAFAANRRFHALPLAAKMAIKQNKWHRGYQAYASSTLKSSARFAPAREPNLLESFFLRHEVSPQQADFGQPLQGPNQWPEDPEFRTAVTRYDTAMRELALRLLPAFSRAVGEAPDFFGRRFAPPATCLRLIHYPAREDDVPAGYGIQPHTDYGFLTILAQDEVGGLQVRRVDGSWIDAPHRPGCFILNAGDALARWTNDGFNSTPHRVVQPPRGCDRYSIGYFFDPDLDAEVRCLAAFCRDAPARHAPIRYGDYFAMRLDANYPDRTGLEAAAG